LGWFYGSKWAENMFYRILLPRNRLAGSKFWSGITKKFSGVPRGVKKLNFFEIFENIVIWYSNDSGAGIAKIEIKFLFSISIFIDSENFFLFLFRFLFLEKNSFRFLFRFLLNRNFFSISISIFINICSSISSKFLEVYPKEPKVTSLGVISIEKRESIVNSSFWAK
jgi:hypothetical protein